eukprot:TRINITY_DN39_c0_g1_i3.p1 TRINITY_DN39_c0_g1~~TRINITY_DN39_c0_g1_i3.p1  ORF type:complete len:130 (+),score=65.00 TRINITY_DN39_c0_g1_i3:163-552(+)
MSDKRIRVYQLRTKNEDELVKELDKQREELLKLRVSKVAGSTAAKLGKIKIFRKTIAKYLTVITQKRRDKVRKDLEKAKRLPLDLRAKKTRAIRQRLNRAQRNRVTLRQKKRDDNLPLRNFALKAQDGE